MIQPDLFFILAKLEGMVWSIVDFLLIFWALKLVNLNRSLNKKKPYKKLFHLLYLSFLLTPLILFVPDFFWFFAIEIIVLNIQYFILGYSFLKNYDLFINFLKFI